MPIPIVYLLNVLPRDRRNPVDFYLVTPSSFLKGHHRWSPGRSLRETVQGSMGKWWRRTVVLRRHHFQCPGGRLSQARLGDSIDGADTASVSCACAGYLLSSRS